MTELPARLPFVLQLIADGKPYEALDEIESILKDESHPELHTLRVQILLPTLEDGYAISESLRWLREHCSPGEIAPLVEQLNIRITAQIETLLKGMDDPDAPLPFVAIDDLTPLVSDYPAVYLLRGMANVHIARIQRKNWPGYQPQRHLRLKREIDEYEAACLNSARRITASFSLERGLVNGRDALESALRALPQGSMYALTLRYMGELHELEGEYEEAMDCYQQARLLKLPVADLITAIKPKVVTRVLVRWLEQFDKYLMAGDFSQVKKLLRAAVVFDKLADIRTRRGDLSLVKGDRATAETHYRQALETLAIDREQFIQEIDPAALVEVREMLQPLRLKPAPQADGGEVMAFARTFATDDTLRRTMAGLIAAYQMGGQAAQAQSLLHQLLTDRDLPARAYPILIALAEKNEVLMRQEQAQHLRSQAHQHRETGDWSEALAAFYNLCSQPNALPEDSAWLAAAVVRADGDTQALLHVLEHTPPAHLAHLPRDLMLEVLERLCAENCWAIADRCVNAVPVPASWRKKYQARLNAYVNSQIEAIRERVESRRFAEVEAMVMKVLPLTADKALLQFLLAKACIGLNKLTEAQGLLKGLRGNAELRDEIALALADIDFQRGFYDEARRRLDAITEMADPKFTAMRRALQNRISRLPAVLVTSSESHVALDSLRRVEGETWSGLFGVGITSVRAGKNLPPTLDSGSEFLTALGQISRAGLNIHFAWRYITERGSLRLTLLCRVEATSADAASSGANNLWFTLRNILPLQNEMFAYEPITSLNELRHILHPFQINSAAEIARKETSVLNAEGEEVYLVYPFSHSKTDLRRTLQLMVESDEPAALDIRFAPTILFPWERRAIEEMIGHERANLIHEALPGLTESDRPTPDFRQKWVANFYPEFLARTHSNAFVTQVQMTSAGALESSLLSLAGMDLFGTSDFEVVRAFSTDELTSAARNMTDLALERWIYTSAPDSIPRWRHLLTPEEALAATRLPRPDSNGLPGITSLKVKMMPMPESFDQDGILLGESAFPVNGRMVKVRSSIDDRLKHTYIVGRTGSGKSTLIQNMALQDIEAGRGVGVIDPHGDLIEAILERIPPHRAGDVVIFDPSDQERPVALNILDVEGAFERNMVIADFLGLLQSMFDPNYQGFVGPRFENIVRQAMLALMEVVRDATLIDVVRVLTDKDYRESVVKDVHDPLVLNYWNNVGKQLDSFGWGSAKGEMIDWITAKFGRFVDDNMMRYIIGQSRNTIDFEGIMNNRQILLVDLSKGKIGPQNSKFLGLLLVPRLLIAAHRRAQLKPDERDPFCLYVDEFQNFTTTSFVEMLSEARKYGVALTMANQFTSQLEPAIREAVFGNVGSMLVFQVGIKDAVALSPELYPVETDDILNLPNYHLFAKLLVNKQVIPPFPVRTLADTRPPNPELARSIRETSRLRYGRDMALVQAEIGQRFKK